MKKYFLIIISIFLIACLTSCTNESNENIEENESGYTIITMGVIDTLDMMNFASRHVAEFNRENEDYFIEVITYTNDELMLLRTELVAGGGPDIIYANLYDDGIFTPMKNQGFLVDLLPFIDADPDIHRDDFFPNILAAMKSRDGSLQTISNQFGISTIFSTLETIDSAKTFTTGYFLQLLHNARDSGIVYPVDRFMSGRTFIWQMLMDADIGIIDFENNVAHFEDRVFYELLEIASLMPDGSELIDWETYNPLGALLRGEHLFVFYAIADIDSFVQYETLLENSIMLGFPSDEGGIYSAFTLMNFGINANSDHLDAAWSFVRQFVHPDLPVDLRPGLLPLRIDLFEHRIFNAMLDIERFSDEGGIQVPIKPLTAEGAQMLREIIESVSFVSKRSNSTIANLLMEELQPYFSGNRSAEETARILQSRVQLYLSERDRS